MAEEKQANSLPGLSVIIPSYNQAAFLEETLQSVLGQNYPALELIVIDGGSTDGSVAIIERYADRIAYWVSEPDRGQSHAINKGLEKATGEWVAWMNSDDCYLPGSLLRIFSENQDSVDFIYGSCMVGPSVQQARMGAVGKESKDTLFDILLFFHAAKHIIPSQSVFLRRTLIRQIGLLNENLQYCMDLDWYCRVYLATEKRRYYAEPVAFFRKLPSTKTSSHGGSMIDEAMQIARHYSRFLSPKERRQLERLLQYDNILFRNIKKDGLPLPTAVRLFLAFPALAVADVRFRTLVKKKLFGKAN